MRYFQPDRMTKPQSSFELSFIQASCFELSSVQALKETMQHHSTIDSRGQWASEPILGICSKINGKTTCGKADYLWQPNLPWMAGDHLRRDRPHASGLLWNSIYHRCITDTIALLSVYLWPSSTIGTFCSLHTNCIVSCLGGSLTSLSLYPLTLLD